MSGLWNVLSTHSILALASFAWNFFMNVDQHQPFRGKWILHFIWMSRSQSVRRGWEETESRFTQSGLRSHVICWCWSTGFSEVHCQCIRLLEKSTALPVLEMEMLVLTSFYLSQNHQKWQPQNLSVLDCHQCKKDHFTVWNNWQIVMTSKQWYSFVCLFV